MPSWFFFGCEHSGLAYCNVDLATPNPGGSKRGEFTVDVSLGSVLNRCQF